MTSRKFFAARYLQIRCVCPGGRGRSREGLRARPDKLRRPCNDNESPVMLSKCVHRNPRPSRAETNPLQGRDQVPEWVRPAATPRRGTNRTSQWTVQADFAGFIPPARNEPNGDVERMRKTFRHPSSQARSACRPLFVAGTLRVPFARHQSLGFVAGTLRVPSARHQSLGLWRTARGACLRRGRRRRHRTGAERTEEWAAAGSSPIALAASRPNEPTAESQRALPVATFLPNEPNAEVGPAVGGEGRGQNGLGTSWGLKLSSVGESR
jgi:hypothetical protein